jgi:hypothetical protein
VGVLIDVAAKEAKELIKAMGVRTKLFLIAKMPLLAEKRLRGSRANPVFFVETWRKSRAII